MSRLDGVETKLGKLEGLFERLENVEAAVSKNCTELNLVNEKTKVIQNNVEEIEKGIVFANSQIGGLEKKDDENARRIKELEDKLQFGTKRFIAEEKIYASLESLKRRRATKTLQRCCINSSETS